MLQFKIVIHLIFGESLNSLDTTILLFQKALHILRLPSDRPASGGRRKRGRPRGRPRKTWRQTFREDLQEMQVSWNGVRRVASDRSRWKSLVAQARVGGYKY